MRYRDSQIIDLPAFTESGERVGRVAGLIVDASVHEIVQYIIARPRTLRAPLPKELLVGREQVVSIDADRMVVRDGTVAEAEQLAETAPATAEAAGVSRMDHAETGPVPRREA